MFSALRKIRNSLQKSSPTKKYLLYALGEILLVMIGILLALQVNNWNEWRLDRAKEVTVLKDLEGTIERNNELMKNMLSLLDRIDDSKEIVLHALENRLPYSDSMNVHFHHSRRRGVATFNLNKDGYESFKNTGFHIITNEALKDEIVYLFEVAIPDAENMAAWVREVGQATRENINEFFYYARDRDVLIPIDYNLLIEDGRYASLLHEVGQTSGFLRPEIIECQQKSESVLLHIQDELRSRESIE